MNEGGKWFVECNMVIFTFHCNIEMATSSRPELIATVPNFEWTEEREEDLIQLWEDNPFLYNTELKDYLNLYKKRETIEKFASILGATGKF